MILGIYGESKSGKTTLIEKLISSIKEKGFKVGSVKNIHTEDFTIDTQGKDTWRHAKAGAEIVVARSENETALIANRKISPNEVATIMEKMADLDLIIVEGFWDDESPKVLVGEGKEKPNTILRYKDNFDEILNYAIEGIKVERVQKKLPGLDCGKCGMKNCMELASLIYQEKKSFDDCYYFSEKRILLEVDGKEIPLGKFAKEILSGTVAGMVSSLKGVKEAKDIKIEIKS